MQEVKQDKTISFLEDKHVDKIFKAYKDFKSVENFSALVSLQDVLNSNGNMSISLYVRPDNASSNFSLPFEEAFENWKNSGSALKKSMSELFQIIEE